MPPSMRMTAGFMDIKNTSNKTIKIIKVSSNLSNFTEMHNHIIIDNKATMSKIKELIIKKNSHILLQKGGLHIMFIGLKKSLKIGDKHNLTLYFDNNTKQTIALEVKRK